MTIPTIHGKKTQTNRKDNNLWNNLWDLLVFETLSARVIKFKHIMVLLAQKHTPWNKQSTWKWIVARWKFLLGWPIFRGYVSFREGKCWAKARYDLESRNLSLHSRSSNRDRVRSSHFPQRLGIYGMVDSQVARKKTTPIQPKYQGTRWFERFKWSHKPYKWPKIHG